MLKQVKNDMAFKNLFKEYTENNKSKSSKTNVSTLKNSSLTTSEMLEQDSNEMAFKNLFKEYQ